MIVASSCCFLFGLTVLTIASGADVPEGKQPPTNGTVATPDKSTTAGSVKEGEIQKNATESATTTSASGAKPATENKKNDKKPVTGDSTTESTTTPTQSTQPPSVGNGTTTTNSTTSSSTKKEEVEKNEPKSTATASGAKPTTDDKKINTKPGTEDSSVKSTTTPEKTIEAPPVDTTTPKTKKTDASSVKAKATTIKSTQAPSIGTVATTIKSTTTGSTEEEEIQNNTPKSTSIVSGARSLLRNKKLRLKANFEPDEYYPVSSELRARTNLRHSRMHRRKINQPSITGIARILLTEVRQLRNDLETWRYNDRKDARRQMQNCSPLESSKLLRAMNKLSQSLKSAFVIYTPETNLAEKHISYPDNNVDYPWSGKEMNEFYFPHNHYGK